MKICLKTHNKAGLLTPKNSAYRANIFQHLTLELKRDLGKGDITTDCLFGKRQKAKARIFARQNGVLAGREEIQYFMRNEFFRVFSRAAPVFKFLLNDGDRISAGITVCGIFGDIAAILAVERSALNFLGRMSGVASFVSRVVAVAKKVNQRVLIVPTRKTLWGLLDKKACSIGGAGTHRLGLDDAVLIKDNHLAAYGRDIKVVLQKISGQEAKLSKVSFIEIEVETIKEAESAAECFKNNHFRLPCFIMLDNFSPAEAKRTVGRLREKGLRSAAGIEVSGGITEKNIAAFAKTGADIISMGSLTRSAAMLDLSLELE